MENNLIEIQGEGGDERPAPDEELELREAPAVEEIAPEAEDEEMPEHLLTEAELEERNREKASKPAPVAKPADDEGARAAVRDELAQIFGTLRQQSAPAGGAPAGPVSPQQAKAVRLTDEQAAKLSEQILSSPGGIARALEAAVELGERRGAARIAGDPAAVGMLQTTGETIADRFAARMLRDPAQKFSKQIAPKFDEALRGYDLSELARMPAAERDAWLESLWKNVGYDALISKAVARPAPSPGVSRGAGARGGAPGRTRVVIQLSESDKQSIYKTLPNSPEGRKKAERQIWEIEHGVTSNPAVARAVEDSRRFGEAVGFGG